MDSPRTATGPARWERMAGFGLLMAGLAPLLMFGAGLLWGLDVSEDAGFFLIAAAIALIGAFVVLRFRSLWSRIVGLICALLISAALFWTAFGLFVPGSFFDFVPGLLVIPGAIIAIVGCIAAIVAASRGKAEQAPADGEKKTVRIALAVVGILALVSAVFTFLGKEDIDESEADTTITLSDFEFDQESYTLEAGSTVLVRNDDPFMHTFTVDDLDIDEMLTPGNQVLIEIPDEPGDYTLYCQPHTSDTEQPTEDDMSADLTVE